MLRFHLSVGVKRQLKNGQTLDVQGYLEAIARKGRRRVKTLENRPRLHYAHAEHWRAFQFLNAQRACSMFGREPIRGSEISAYLDELGIRSPAIRQEFHRVIRTVDHAYLTHNDEEPADG